MQIPPPRKVKPQNATIEILLAGLNTIHAGNHDSLDLLALERTHKAI